VPSETVDRARSLLEKRRTELRDELQQIEKAIAGLGGRRRRSAGRPRGTGRPRRGGGRSDQAVRIIKQNPGITVSELGRKMKLNHPNDLYRVLPGLEKDGRVKRRGRGYHAG
jgi:hypothetical protein